MSQSVRRAAEILRAIAAEPSNVASLAVRFGLHRSTMFRELRALEEAGFARRRGDGTYAIAFGLVTLAQAALEEVDLRTAAHDHARRLHRELGATVHVAALIDDAIVYVDKVEDAAGIRMYSRVGSPVRPHCSALGKAVLAGLDEAGRDAVLAGTDWRPYTERTITTRAELDAELARVAERGWASDDGEFEDFVHCVAVPIVGPLGVVGALSFTTIRRDDDLGPLIARVPLLRQAARHITKDLG